MTVEAPQAEHNRRAPRTRLDVLLNAREVLQKQGWYQGGLQNNNDRWEEPFKVLPASQGPVCLQGALILGVANHGITDMDTAQQRIQTSPGSLFTSTERFLQRVIVEYELKRDGEYIRHLLDDDYYGYSVEALLAGKGTSIPSWNDDPKTTEEQALEVVNLAIEVLEKNPAAKTAGIYEAVKNS